MTEPFYVARAIVEPRELLIVDEPSKGLAPAIVQNMIDAFAQLKARGVVIDSAELAMVPKSTVKVEGADAERILRLIEVLEELDDVSKVFSNFDIDAAHLAEAQA